MAIAGEKLRGAALAPVIPKRVAAAEVELAANERVVLSLVDDRSTVAEIGEMLGASEEQLSDLFFRLEGLGVVDLGRTQAPQGSLERSTAQLLDHETARKTARRVLPEEASAAEPEAEPEELEELVELPLELQHEIDEVADRVCSSDPYQVLGCAPGAPRDEIRSHYHAGIRRYHPDRYFGKQLGGYKSKLERIFKRLTAAHEALEASLPPPPRASKPSPSASSPAVSAVIPPPPNVPGVGRAPSAVNIRAESHGASSQRPAVDPDSVARIRVSESGESSDARRRALARKLSDPRMRRVSVKPPPSEQQRDDVRAAARDSMRRLQAERANDPTARLQRYLETATEAERSHDLISARNAVKIALSLAPEDKQLAERLAKLEQAVAVKHADEYIQRAQVAERQEQWREAAMFYERAALGRPHNGQLLERAAVCILSEGKDIAGAIRLAKAAVLHSPQRVANRVALARAYLAAEMKKSAQGEYERAKELDAHDPGVRALGKSLGRR